MIDISDTLAGKVQVGEYIEYTPLVGKSYTVEKSLSGTTGIEYEQWCANNGETQVGEETFTTNANVEIWRVLSIEGANVTIMRENPICPNENTSGLRLYGKIGYDNAEVLLNKICGIYKNETYAKSARSIRIEDINKVTGYVVPAESENPCVGEYGSIGYGGNKYTYYWYNNVSQMHNISDISDSRYTMIFNKSYWIASCCVEADSLDAFFRVRCVSSDSVKTEFLCVNGDF